MRIPSEIRRWAVPFALVSLLTLPAAAQDATPEASSPPPPTTAPATAPVNHLRSPHATVAYFLEQCAAAEGEQPDLSGAMSALDFGALTADQEKLADAAPQYVRQLEEILQRLITAEQLDLGSEDALPTDPATPSPHSIGADPLILVLERADRTTPDSEQTVKQWMFSWPTVEKVPEWHEKLDDLIQQIGRRRLTADVIEDRRTLYGFVKYFLEQATALRESEDLDAYEAAVACMDFAAVLEDLKDRTPAGVETFFDNSGPTYIDGLERVFDALLKTSALDLEALPKDVDPQRKATYAIAGSASPSGESLQIVLIRTGDVEQGTSQWTVATQTVEDIPRMVRALKAPAPAPAATDGAAAPAAATGAPPGATTATIPIGVDDDTRSPRATLQAFLQAMKAGDLERAVHCIDVERMSADDQRTLAPMLAGKLWLTLMREEKPVLQAIPDDPATPDPYELLRYRVRAVEIGRKRGGDRAGEWLVTQRSLNNIEPIYEALQGRPIHADWKAERLSFWTLPSLYVREYLVPTGLKAPFWGLRQWQWVGLLAVIVLGILVRMLSQFVLPAVSRAILQTEGAAMLPNVVRNALRPTSNLAMVATWWGGLQLLDLGTSLLSWIWPVMRVAMAVTAVVALYRLIDVISNYFAARASRTSSRLDDVLVPLAQKTSKIVVVAVGVVLVVNAFGFEISPLLAGLGIGGLAISFAAKDTIANFFGSVNVVLDRPFQVGDWVTIGDAEGTVESVGLRSSRIRTFYNSQLTIPNAEIMNATVDNMGRRRYRRTSTALSVTYDTTPEQLEALCEGIREIIRLHPYTRKDYFHVYVKAFAASSIDIMLYCFHECPDWGTELRERHRLYLDILRLAERLGVSWAFPTQTIHLHNEDGNEPQPPGVPLDPAGARDHGKQSAAGVVEQFKEDVK